jgi:hypothetical protein
VKKGPGNPISLVSADLRWQRGQPPMPHPSSHAGPVPAPAVPCLAGTGEQQSVTAFSGPGLGVPVSIWPHAPVPGSGPVPGPGCVACASCAARASGPDTAQIITAFSRPGELVVIPGARDGALVAAAAAAGRRVLGLAPGPGSRQRVLACLGGVDPGLRPLAEVRPGGPALLLEAGNPDAGQAALVITGGAEPSPPCPGEPAADPGVLYAACQRVLRPGGVLAVLTASTPHPGGLRDDPGEAISRARAAGLIYAQHIVALHAPITGSQITPAPGDAAHPGEVAGLAAVHARTHSDFLVFTAPGGTPR